jgi:hypothetical protein
VVMVVVVVVVVVVMHRHWCLLRTRRRLLSSTTRRRWMVEGEVPVTHESRPPPRIPLGLEIAVPAVGVDVVGGIGAEVPR